MYVTELKKNYRKHLVYVSIYESSLPSILRFERKVSSTSDPVRLWTLSKERKDTISVY